MNHVELTTFTDVSHALSGESDDIGDSSSEAPSCGAVGPYEPLTPGLPWSTGEQGLLRFIPPVLYRLKGWTSQLEHQVATLFVDVAGFTALSENLANLGPEGAEQLEQIMSSYFDGVLEVIESYQGLPVKISGDSLMLVFPALDGSLRPALLRALACAAALQRESIEHSQGQVGPRAYLLTHKIGVGVGRLLSSAVGDPRLRTEYVFAGEAVEQAARAEHRAKAGQVWVSPEAVAMAEQQGLWEGQDADGFCLLRRRLSTCRLPLPGPPLATPGQEELGQLLSQHRALVPRAVLEQARQNCLQYLCRHQTLTVLFVGWPELTLDSPEALQLLDAQYRAMQQVIEEYGGFLSEFEAGDKGAKLIVLFGAPTPLDEPALQASRCALAMQEQARAKGLVADQRVGLATGRLYVGRIGCRTLVKYSAIGDRMNLASRLMLAADRWSILAEEVTVERSTRAIQWSAPRPLHVKGKEENVTVSALELARPPSGRERRGKGLIGRLPERQQVQEQLTRLQRGRGGILRVEGEAGTGKSRFLSMLGRQALELGISQVTEWNGRLSSTMAAPLSAFRPLLLALEGSSLHASPGEIRRAHEAYLSRQPPLVAEHGRALTELLALESSQRLLNASSNPERDALRLQEALLEFLRTVPLTQPHVYLMDCAERLDLTSAQLLPRLAPQLVNRRLLLILAHRPDPPGAPYPLSRLDGLRGSQRLMLGPLPASEAALLAARRLQVHRLDTSLETFLLERAHGNPLLIEGWIDLLVKHGRIRISDHLASLASTVPLPLRPEVLETLVLSQLESLPPEARLTVEVASVLEGPFLPAELEEIHPEHPSESALTAQLRLASQAGVLWYDRTPMQRLYFSHPEVREAIHDSLPFQLRRYLHTRRARVLELHLRDRLDDEQWLQLARHYEYVEDVTGRRRVFRRAAQICQERHAWQSCAAHASALLEACEQLADPAGMLEALEHLREANAHGVVGVTPGLGPSLSDPLGRPPTRSPFGSSGAPPALGSSGSQGWGGGSSGSSTARGALGWSGAGDAPRRKVRRRARPEADRRADWRLPQGAWLADASSDFTAPE